MDTVKATNAATEDHTMQRRERPRLKSNPEDVSKGHSFEKLSRPGFASWFSANDFDTGNHFHETRIYNEEVFRGKINRR
jgi:hypothetical protein